MIASQELAQILADEGFREKPYQDHLGVWTIGHGLTWLSEKESAWIVESRLAGIQNDVERKWPWVKHSHPEVQRVLINMVYQLGLTGVSRFNMTLKHLEAQNYKAASKEMLDSKWAAQTPNRAKRLSDRIRVLA